MVSALYDYLIGGHVSDVHSPIGFVTVTAKANHNHNHNHNQGWEPRNAERIQACASCKQHSRTYRFGNILEYAISWIWCWEETLFLSQTDI
jgi:hypothetical protein